MQITETQHEIERVVERLRTRLTDPPRRTPNRNPCDAARAEIDRIRKRFQRKINATWHPIHSRAGIEAKLAEVVEAGFAAIEQIESAHAQTNA